MSQIKPRPFDRAAAEAHLHVLFSGLLHGWPGSWLCLGAMDREGNWEQGFAGSVKEAVVMLKGWGERSVYCRNAVYAERSGEKKNAYATRALHVDFDGKPEAFYAALAASTLPAPSLTVHTGGGVHAYWLLRDLVDLRIPSQLLAYEARLKGVQVALGGDPAATDAGRQLRIPGSWNYLSPDKRAKGRIEAACDVVESHPERRYALEDFPAAESDRSGAAMSVEDVPGLAAEPEWEGSSEEDLPQELRDLLAKDEDVRERFERKSDTRGDGSESARDFELAALVARRTGDPCLGYVATKASRSLHVGDDKCERDDYFRQTAARAWIQEWAFTRAPFPPEPEGLPLVCVDGQLSDVQAAIGRAVLQANSPPRLFAQGGEIVCVRSENGEPTAGRLGVPGFRAVAADAAHYYRPTKQGRANAKLAKDSAESAMHWLLGQGALPPLRGIARNPVMREDGSVLAGTGYDPATRLYAGCAGVDDLDVPERPTPEQVAVAREALLEVIVNFPFADQASRAHALAALLTMLMREAIPGPVPLFAIDAPTAGTGKGLLARVLALIARGAEPQALPQPGNEEEWRKRILSQLLAGRDLAMLDNVEGELRSPSLCAALTSISYEDRQLGSSTMRAVPNRLLWLATGNNLRLTGDLTRRAVWCRLDAKMARPDERPESKFRHPDLASWVLTERPRLLQAAFTLARAWVAAGRPGPAPGTPILGSFENWRHVVGGTLHVAGISGFLANRADLFAAMDEEGAAWAAFLGAWADAHGSRAVTVREMISTMALLDLLPEALGEADKGLNRRLGDALRSRVGRRHALPDGTEVWVERSAQSATGGNARWIVRRSQ